MPARVKILSGTEVQIQGLLQDFIREESVSIKDMQVNMQVVFDPILSQRIWNLLIFYQF